MLVQEVDGLFAMRAEEGIASLALDCRIMSCLNRPLGRRFLRHGR